MAISRVCLSFFLGIITIGCTEIKVRRIDVDDAKTTMVSGIRYSLPKPFIRVTPKPDGGVDVDVAYLPDGDSTYAINASSKLADHTLNVTLENGMLKNLQFKGDTTAVPTQAAQTASNATTKTIEAQAKAMQDAQAAAQTQAKTVGDAKLAVTVAKARLQAMVDRGGADPKDLAKAAADVAEAETRLAALTGGGSGAGGGGNSATTGGGGATRPSTGNAAQPAPDDKAVSLANLRPAPPKLLEGQTWISLRGPVLYAVNERGDDNVELRAVMFDGSEQNVFPTTTQPSQQPTAQAPILSPDNVVLIFGDPAGKREMILNASAPLTGILNTSSSLLLLPPGDAAPVQKVTPPIEILPPNQNKIRVDLTGVMPGTYRLLLAFSYKDRDASKSDLATVTFRIVN
jgi:hypothetical protein